MREDYLKQSHKSLSTKNIKNQKKSLFDANEARISRIKKSIEGLEETINNLEEELKKIINA
jgi:hypothetical protein